MGRKLCVCGPGGGGGAEEDRVGPLPGETPPTAPAPALTTKTRTQKVPYSRFARTKAETVMQHRATRRHRLRVAPCDQRGAWAASAGGLHRAGAGPAEGQVRSRACRCHSAIGTLTP